MGAPVLGGKRRAYGDADAFPRKRRATAEAEAPDWSSLHPDITSLIAELLLAEDMTEYMRFRSVCSHWRASTASPRDATLADRRFHPRGWVALCNGNGVRPVEDTAITFFHTATSRVCRLSLPGLRRHRIVGFIDGLIIVLDTRAAVIRDVHPFTRVVVELPHLATFFHCVQEWFTRSSSGDSGGTLAAGQQPPPAALSRITAAGGSADEAAPVARMVAAGRI